MTDALFSFETTLTNPGVKVKLTRKSDNQVKEFLLVSHTSNCAVVKHMESLTDDQCSSFFPAARQVKAKK